MSSKNNNTYLDVKVVDITTPVTFIEFKGPEFPPNYNLVDLHSDVIRIIKETGDIQRRTTNVKAVMTDWLMTEHPPFKMISDHVENLVQWFYRENTTLDLKTFMTTCWGAIYNKGDYSEPHAHCPAFLSWVYYVKAGNNASPLKFYNGYSYQPKSGYGIIFPGWLIHEVEPEIYDEERIIVVGNIEATGPVNYPQKQTGRFMDIKKGT
jgi:hypothetical protein